MTIDYNRIKVADLETNEPNKTLITNENGELEFSDITGGGGSQNLQEVLNIGNTASIDDGGFYPSSVTLLNEDKYGFLVNELIVQDSNANRSWLQLRNNTLFLENSNPTGSKQSQIFLTLGELELLQSGFNGQTSVKINPPVAETTIKFPAKAAGEYTLATLDDISGTSIPNLEQVLQAGGTVTTNNYITFDNADDGYTYLNQSGLSILRAGRSTSVSDESVFISDVLTDSSINLKGNRARFSSPNGISPKFAEFYYPTNKPDGYVGTYAMLDDITGGVSGTPNNIPKINGTGDGTVNSTMSDNGTTVTIDNGIPNTSGLKFANLKNTISGISSIFGTTGSAPNNIAKDADGNIYTANNNANSVTKITPDGTSSIFGITGSAPYDIVIDADGNIYTSNNGANSVTKITPDGTSSIFGTTGDSPFGIAIDTEGNIYTSNIGAGNITKITPEGVSSIFATIGGNPTRVVVDSNNYVYVIGGANSNDITIINPEGNKNTINIPSADYLGNLIVTANGDIYVTDSIGGTVIKANTDGTSSIFGTAGNYPSNIVMDSNGNIYTANSSGNNVTKITPDGTSSIFGNTGNYPTGIVLGADGNIYTSNASGNNVTKITHPELPKLLTVDEDGNVIKDTKDYLTKEDIFTLAQVTEAGAYTKNEITVDHKSSEYNAVISGGTVAVTHVANEAHGGETTSIDPRAISNQGSGEFYGRYLIAFPETTSNDLIEFHLPVKPDGFIGTIATTSDFKTINGESIIGSGDIVIGGGSGGSQNIDQTLTQGNFTNQQINFGYDPENPSNQEMFISPGGVSFPAKTSGSRNMNMYVHPDYGVYMNAAPGNTSGGAAYLENGIKFYGPYGTAGYTTLLHPETFYDNTNPVISLPSYNNSNTYTLATTSDFKTVNGQSVIGTGDVDTTPILKTINGQSIIGTGDIVVGGSNDIKTVSLGIVHQHTGNGITTTVRYNTTGETIVVTPKMRTINIAGVDTQVMVFETNLEWNGTIGGQQTWCVPRTATNIVTAGLVMGVANNTEETNWVRTAHMTMPYEYKIKTFQDGANNWKLTMFLERKNFLTGLIDYPYKGAGITTLGFEITIDFYVQ